MQSIQILEIFSSIFFWSQFSREKGNHEFSVEGDENGTSIFIFISLIFPRIHSSRPHQLTWGDLLSIE